MKKCGESEQSNQQWQPQVFLQSLQVRRTFDVSNKLLKSPAWDVQIISRHSTCLTIFSSTNFPMKKFSSTDIITYSAKKCVLLLPLGKEALHSCLLLLEDGVSIYMFNYLSIWLFSRSDLPSRTHTCFWILQLPLGLCMHVLESVYTKVNNVWDFLWSIICGTLVQAVHVHGLG